MFKIRKYFSKNRDTFDDLIALYNFFCDEMLSKYIGVLSDENFQLKITI